MRGLKTIIMKRRVAQLAILLFCFSNAESQFRVNRALCKGETRIERVTKGNSPGTIEHDPTVLRGIVMPFDENQLLTAVILVDTVRGGAVKLGEDSLGVEGSLTTGPPEGQKRSPTLAMLLSTLVPGAGQIYVKRYITIPFIWGFGYYFARSWSKQNDQYGAYRDLYEQSVKSDTVKNTGDLRLRDIRDLYRDDRDKFAFYLAITYILNIVDAYVGASLYSFDVSDQLGGSAALRFRIPIR
jgi:hypothetical protein